MLRRHHRPEVPASGFTSPHAVAPTDLLGWAALSLAADYPAPTGSAMLDMHNQAIGNVQAYLNGRAVAAETDEEKAYLLRLRSDLNFLLVPAGRDAATEPDGDAGTVKSEAESEAGHYVHCGCDQHGDHGGCAPACADNFGCTEPDAGAA